MPYAKSEQTQQRLVQSAARLLRARGYAATGVSAIVADSGVPKGSLYHHFPGGKEELAAAAVRVSGEAIVERLGALLAAAPGPVEATRRFCDYYVAQLEQSGFRRGCPLATVALEAAPEVDAVHRACAEAFDGVTGVLADALVAAGVGPAAATRTAVGVVAALEGALLLAKARRDVAPLCTVRDELAERLGALLESVQEDP